MHRVVIKKCRSRSKTFELAWFKTLFSSTCAKHCGRGGGESNPDKGLSPQVLPVSGPVWAGDSCEQHLGGTHSVSLTSHRERNIMTKVSDPTLCPSSPRYILSLHLAYCFQSTEGYQNYIIGLLSICFSRKQIVGPGQIKPQG